ncbi:hypothetical protein [Streptomyces sp. NPDC048639]|uniref:hypothetical protein n=1 Tax=Streptomyces sp. NPDC048639 TaxID=3365581 RepID=UPI0037209F15
MSALTAHSLRVLAEGPTMTRVAGLPAAAVEPFTAPEVAGLLDGIAAATAELTALATDVTDLLHDAVPHMPSPGARRAVLAWRRAAHTARPLDVGTDLPAAVRSQLSGTDTGPLDRWTHGAAELRALRADLCAAAAEAEHRERAHLRELLGVPALANALALVSPVFHRSSRLPAAGRLSRGERLTAYRYVVRAALKTSPLSSFTELAAERAADRGRVRVSLHPLILQVLLRSAGHRPGIREHLDWRVNASLRRDPEDASVARLGEPRQHAGDGFGWSDSETIEIREGADPTSALVEPDRISARRLARHLESGLVGIDDPCPQEELLDWLTARLAASPDQRARGAGRSLARVGAALASLPEADAEQRAHALTVVDTGLRSALGELGAADGWPVTAVTAVYEDRAAAEQTPGPAPEHRAALRRYAELACDGLEVSPVYRSMVETFVARYGAGGVCSDVYGFCGELERSGWPYTLGLERSGASGDAVRPGRSSCRPSVSVLCQVVADGGPGGEPVLVANQLSTGTGGLLARFHRLFDDAGGGGGADGDGREGESGEDGESGEGREDGESGESGLGDRLRAWLRTLYPQARLLEFVPARDANPLQADSTGLLPALHWPTATRQWGPGTAVEELTLVHDRSRGALELRAPDGAVVAPVYLGTVPQHLIAGPMRALTVLADPWQVPVDLADAAVPGGLAAAGRTGHLPRRTVAGVVVRRARWRVHAAKVPRRDSGEGLADFLERMDRWRGERGLPAEAYVRAEADVPQRDDRTRKPLWLALASPIGLEALAHLATSAGTHRLVFSECLPVRSGHAGVGGHGDGGGAGDGGGTGDASAHDDGARATEHVLHFARITEDPGGP